MGHRLKAGDDGGEVLAIAKVGGLKRALGGRGGEADADVVGG
jgi:hypothetical protein